MQTCMTPCDIFRLSNSFGIVPAVVQESVKTCSQLVINTGNAVSQRDLDLLNMATSADTIIQILQACTIVQALLLLFHVILEYLSKSLSSFLFKPLKK